MRFGKKQLQQFIDDYLAETGENQFVPSAFVAWLGGKPQHPLHALVFSKTNDEAAFAWRVDYVRRLTSGLRITVKIEETKRRVTSVVVRQFPAMVSPVAGRRLGGGYSAFDPNDAESVAELVRQGLSALNSWVGRFGDVFDHAKIDISAIRALVEEKREVA